MQPKQPLSPPKKRKIRSQNRPNNLRKKLRKPTALKPKRAESKW